MHSIFTRQHQHVGTFFFTDIRLFIREKERPGGVSFVFRMSRVFFLSLLRSITVVGVSFFFTLFLLYFVLSFCFSFVYSFVYFLFIFCLVQGYYVKE